MPRKSWTKISGRHVSDHRILRIRQDLYRFRNGNIEREFVVIEAPDWVNVVAVTEANEIVLIRQFRHGIADVTLEIPGGMVDDGEEPAEAALRELKEETGFSANRAFPLGMVWPNPAIQENRCFTFLAPGARPDGPADPDPMEQIEVLTVPVHRVDSLVRSGEIRHSLVVAALGLAGMLSEPGRLPGDDSVSP